MLKIHILGGPGSGKTTLAQHLTARFHVKHYDLDKIGWKNGKRAAAYIVDACEIAAQPSWITEGIYLIWTDPLLYQADYIVLLEISWPVAAWRIISRHITRSLHGTNPYPGLKGWRALLWLLSGTHDYVYNQDSDAAITAEFTRLYFAEYGDRATPLPAERLAFYLDQYHQVALAPTAAFVDTYLERFQEKIVVVKNKTDRARLLARLDEEFPDT